MRENKYRIITDGFLGYSAQIKYWFFPWRWFELWNKEKGFTTNTHMTLKEAEIMINRHKNGLLKKKKTKYKIVKEL